MLILYTVRKYDGFSSFSFFKSIFLQLKDVKLNLNGGKCQKYIYLITPIRLILQCLTLIVF